MSQTDSTTPVPALPRTWRPFGPRMAGAVFAIVLIGAFAWLWLRFDDETRDLFGFWQQITGIALVVVALALLNALARSKVVARPEGLVVVNGYRRRELAWAEVGPLRMPRGAPWPHLDMGDGEKISLLGIHTSDGRRAEIAVRELRAVVAAHATRA